MTSITKSLPWFVKEPAVALIGEVSAQVQCLHSVDINIQLQKCYTSLIEELHLGDVDCLKYTLSKGLGLGIVVGGAIMKVPQILLSV
jgi:mannose-P-dolichol utilization defect protein 1